ncbi:hypothetical protein ACFL2A_06465 [Thermodesulfobacteriota bacterium]
MNRINKAVIIVLLLLVTFVVATPSVVKAGNKNAASAALLSLIMPGAGEWYNDGYKRDFPWSECVIGKVCFFFTLSSVVDAANGDGTDKIRYDFWSTPQK